MKKVMLILGHYQLLLNCYGIMAKIAMYRRNDGKHVIDRRLDQDAEGSHLDPQHKAENKI